MERLMDLDGVLDRFDGDREVLQEVVQLFLEEYPTLMAEIRQAIGGRDPSGLEHSAHTLKGSVSNFSPIVASKFFELEKLGKRGTTEGAQPYFAAAEQALKDLSAELAAFLVPSAQS